MKTDLKYDFAVSYAAPDEKFVAQVVKALNARGLSVFYAPKHQANLIGRVLRNELNRTFKEDSRYCLVFISEHYAKSRWTMKVELPAARERETMQKSRYIIPIRLDNTVLSELTDSSLEGARLDIRNAGVIQIADLAVALLLGDEAPTSTSDNGSRGDCLILRVTTLTDFDTDILRSSFRTFDGVMSENPDLMAVEIRLPKFITDAIAHYEDILTSRAFARVDTQTQQSFTHFVKMIRTEFLGQLLRAPSYVLRATQPKDASSLIMTDPAVELIRRFVLAKTIVLARCIVSYQLKGFPKLPWAHMFADCATLWSGKIMGGLAWLCRCDASEPHMWFQVDMTEWGSQWVSFPRFRLYVPSKFVAICMGDKLREDGVHEFCKERPSADDVWKFLAPQFLEKELEGEVRLLNLAYRYPELMRFTVRGEEVIESQHFYELNLSNAGDGGKARPALAALRDEIIRQRDAGIVTSSDAIQRLDRVRRYCGGEDVFSPTIRKLRSELSEEKGCSLSP